MARKASKPEKVEEGKFVKAVHQMGGICEKQQMFGAYGRIGFSDRLTILPRCVILFFEFKRNPKEGGVVSKHQKKRHKHLTRLGIPNFVVYTCQEAVQISKTFLRAVAVSTKEYPLWRKPRGGWIPLSPRLRKDRDNFIYLQNTKATRISRRAAGTG